MVRIFSCRTYPRYVVRGVSALAFYAVFGHQEPMAWVVHVLAHEARQDSGVACLKISHCGPVNRPLVNYQEIEAWKYNNLLLSHLLFP